MPGSDGTREAGMIRCVISDLGKVLIYFDNAIFYRRMAAVSPLDADRICSVVDKLDELTLSLVVRGMVVNLIDGHGDTGRGGQSDGRETQAQSQEESTTETPEHETRHIHREKTPTILGIGKGLPDLSGLERERRILSGPDTS